MRPAYCRLGGLSVDSLFHTFVRVRTRSNEGVQHPADFDERDIFQCSEEVDERAWCTAHDGAVWVGASRGIDAVDLTFTVEVAWKDRGF